MDCTKIAELIATAWEQIDAINAAILALSSGTVKEYMLDTGQSRQRVEKKDLHTLRRDVEGLLSYIQSLEALCYGTGNIHVAPGW